MNKKLKITLGGIIGIAAFAGIAGGVCAAVHNTSNNTTSLKASTYSDQTTSTANLSVTPVAQDSKDSTQATQTQEYAVKLESQTVEHGKVFLVDPKTGKEATSITVTPGQTVSVRAEAGEGYTLGRLYVYGNNENITLGTEQHGGHYTFTIPSDLGKESVNGMPNPFQPGAGNTITVKATFVKDVINTWGYNFNLKSYVYSVQSDNVVLNNEGDLGLEKFAMSNDIGTDTAHPTNFILLLNGHTVKVDSFTVPAWCNLILLNNLNNSQTNGKDGTLVNGTTGEGFIVGGVLTTYQHITNNASVDGQRTR